MSSSWRSIVISICVVISLSALAISLWLMMTMRTPAVKTAQYATNSELAYYISSSAYKFYLSADKQTLEVKDNNGNSVNLKLNGDVRFQKLEINSWKIEATESNGVLQLVPPTDCEFIQIGTYPGLFHKDLATSVSTLECKQNIDSNVIESLEE